MVLYERHIQVSVLNLINAASLRVEYQWRKHLFLSGCPNESHIVLRCTYNESQVRPPGKRRDGHGIWWERGEERSRWGRRRRRSSSSASPILMCFFDRPWNYAWWFLKCFNWSGPKLKLNSILGGRQHVCFFCLFCSQDAKVGNPIKIPKAFTLLEKSFFQLPKQSSLSSPMHGKDSQRSSKMRRQIEELNKFLCCLDYFASFAFSSKLNERVFMFFPVLGRFVDTIQNETELK